MKNFEPQYDISHFFDTEFSALEKRGIRLIEENVAAVLESEQADETFPFELLAHLAEHDENAKLLEGRGWVRCGFTLDIASYGQDQVDLLKSGGVDEDFINQTLKNEVAAEGFLVISRPLLDFGKENKEMFKHFIGSQMEEIVETYSGPQVYAVMKSSGEKKLFIDNPVESATYPPDYLFLYPSEVNSASPDFHNSAITQDEWKAMDNLLTELHNSAVEQMGQALSNSQGV